MTDGHILFTSSISKLTQSIWDTIISWTDEVETYAFIAMNMSIFIILQL